VRHGSDGLSLVLLEEMITSGNQSTRLSLAPLTVDEVLSAMLHPHHRAVSDRERGPLEAVCAHTCQPASLSMN
jgi:hypothetical protein